MASTKRAEPPAKRHRDWADLPTEVTAMILHKLGAVEILESAQKVCFAWFRTCKDPAMWRTIDTRNKGLLCSKVLYFEKMVMHAVDRSCGQLVNISVQSFCSGKIVKHIADRSSQLRCLRLVRCHDSFSSEAFIEAIEKLPLLEDIHIHYATISKEAVAAAGRCCPMLKSFKLNKKAYKIPDFECDDEALAIAGSMPGLRYLQLIGSKITNRGLQAILDKCPHLEYLDLRQCLNLRLEGNMGKLCSERIKDFRHPNDSTDDYEFATPVCRIY